MTDRHLTAVPDLEPQGEVTEGAPDEPVGYTVADQVHRNASLLAELVELHGLEQPVAVQLIGLTFSYHLQKIQMGLSAPVEG